jgi:peroxiredoxin
MMAEASASKVGSPAPRLELPDTEGNVHTLSAPGEAPATVVVWTCNHCPYALAWHDRLVDAAREYGPRGVRFLAVNSNDAERYPRDSLEAMRERVRREDWPFPYLHDSSQAVARDWAAQVTPHVYVLDSDLRVRYEGAPDSDHMDPGQNASWLREALDAVLAGEDPPRKASDPVGCSIKWKP